MLWVGGPWLEGRSRGGRSLLDVGGGKRSEVAALVSFGFVLEKGSEFIVKEGFKREDESQEERAKWLRESLTAENSLEKHFLSSACLLLKDLATSLAPDLTVCDFVKL